MTKLDNTPLRIKNTIKFICPETEIKSKNQTTFHINLLMWLKNKLTVLKFLLIVLIKAVSFEVWALKGLFNLVLGTYNSDDSNGTLLKLSVSRVFSRVIRRFYRLSASEVLRYLICVI